MERDQPGFDTPVSDAGIAAFIDDFEACRLPKSRWTHQAHRAQHRDAAFQDSLAQLLSGPLTDRNWALNYYSLERLFSVTARREWVKPDLQALELHATIAP